MDRYSTSALKPGWGRAASRWLLAVVGAAAFVGATPSMAEAGPFKAYVKTQRKALGKAVLKRAKFWWPMSGVAVGSVLSKAFSGSWTHHVASPSNAGTFLGDHQHSGRPRRVSGSVQGDRWQA